MTETTLEDSPSEKAVDKKLIVEDVVFALTGEEEPGSDTTGDLRTQMERAAEEFDRRTAEAFGRALLDSLTEDPGNLRQLEALLILGLAHPDVLRKNRISLAVEGRRLAILLERAGDVQRARGVLELLSNRLPEERTIDTELAGIMRRSGNTDELVERYISRAQACVLAGKISEAIPWLQEILLIDRTRRDVARMIRDLRYQEAERRARASKRNKVVLIALLISSLVTAAVLRDLDVRGQYEAIPTAMPNSVDELSARLFEIERFLDDKRFWTGMSRATRERASIQERLDALREEAGRVEHARRAERTRLLEMADASRAQGNVLVERGRFDDAIEEFERALSIAPSDWEHRTRVETDVAALREWDGRKP